MAIAFVQSTHGASASVATQVISLNGVGAGNLLVLPAFPSNGLEVVQVIDSQSNLWIRGCLANASAALDAEMWYASGAKSGNTTASVTFSSAIGTGNDLVLMEFSGVSSINAMDQECPNAGTGTVANTGASVQGAVAGTLFITSVIGGFATNPTTPSGWASVATGDTFAGVAYLIDAGQSTHNPSWALNMSQLWLTNTISFTTPQENAPLLNPSYDNGWPFPQIQVEWSPTQAPFTPVWRNVAKYVQNFKTTQGRQHQLDRIEAGSIDITFDGRDGTFNPWNASSILFNNFQGLQPMNVIRITASWQGITYYVAYGYVQSITPTLTDPVNVDVDVKCWDILQFLSLRYLSGPNYATLIEAESSLCAYWRCGDPIGGYNKQVTTAVNQLFDSTPTTNAGYGPFPANILNGPGGYPALGAQGQLLYDASTAIDLTNGTNLPNGGFAAGSPLASASAWTFESWIQFGGDSVAVPSVSASVGNQTLFTTSASVSGTEFDIRAGYATNGAGTSLVTYYNTIVIGTVTGGVFTEVGWVTGGPNIFDGTWHHVVLTYPSLNVYIDGNLQNMLFVGAAIVSNPVGTVVGCNSGAVNGFAGSMQEVALYSSSLSANDITTHYNQGRWFRLSGETGGSNTGTGPSAVGRLNHVLAVAGFPSTLYAIGAPYLTPVYGEDNPITTTTALDMAQILMETEPGIIFQGQDGNIYALNRQYVIGHGGSFGIMNSSRAANSNGLFIDSVGGTYRYEFKNFDVGQDDLDTWNDIQAQSARPGTPAPVLQEVDPENDMTGIAALSASAYGQRTLQGLTSLLFLNDSDALAVAQQYLRWYAAGIQRAPSIKIQNTANQGINLPQILGRTIYDRLSIGYQGQTPGNAFLQDSIIESIAHDVDVLTGIWATDFAMSPYEISIVTISAGGGGNPPAGQLTSGNATPMVLGVFKFGDTSQLLL